MKWVSKHILKVRLFDTLKGGWTGSDGKEKASLGFKGMSRSYYTALEGLAQHPGYPFVKYNTDTTVIGTCRYTFYCKDFLVESLPCPMLSRGRWIKTMPQFT